MRWVIAALVVVGLAVGVVLLWPTAPADDSPTTLAAPTTTTSGPAPTTSATTTAPTSTTTTTTADSHVVETVEEAETILRELWFGWFEGIYNEDEERIREVVVLEETVDTAKESFGSMEFDRAPSSDLIHLSGTEILRSEENCLAIWSELEISGFRKGAQGTSGVYVLRSPDGEWKLLSVWPNRGDLWEADCESRL